MGVLGQYAPSGQRLAELTPGPQRRVDVRTGPESAAADLDNTSSDEPLEPLLELNAQSSGTILVVAGLQKVHHGVADRARQRIATERAAVLPRPQHAEHIPIRHHG